MNLLKRSLLSFSLVAALAAAGCGGGQQSMATMTPAPTPAPTSTTANFTEWSTVDVFAQPENATPVNMDTLVFNFDGDDNPTAYVALLPAM